MVNASIKEEILAGLDKLDPVVVEVLRQLVSALAFVDPCKQSEHEKMVLAVVRAIESVENIDDMTPEEATQEILDAPEMMEAIRRGKEDIKAGRVISWEDFRRSIF